MKKSLLVVVLASVSQILQAQQDPQLTQWQYDRVSFNPAAAGMNCMHCLTTFHRDQWDGLDHDPKSYLFNYEGLWFDQKGLGAINGGLGLGVTFLNEVLGQQKNTIVRLNIAPKFNLNNGSTLSAGVSLGGYLSKLGANWVYIDDNDPTIPTKELSAGTFDLGFGATLYKKGQYYIGASATHLTAGELKNLRITTARHFYLMGGYEYGINSSLTLRPNALLKTDFNATAIDINADVLWNNMLWGGLAFRPGDAIAPYVGFQTNFAPTNLGPKSDLCEHGLKIGYSYDVTTSELKDYSAGSHEIFIAYCMRICPIIIRAKNHNTRFL
ncbi:MAG: PorP/SprF family type IX secretion system membrane protein [Flavobacteriales bacterium]